MARHGVSHESSFSISPLRAAHSRRSLAPRPRPKAAWHSPGGAHEGGGGELRRAGGGGCTGGAGPRGAGSVAAGGGAEPRGGPPGWGPGERGHWGRGADRAVGTHRPPDGAVFPLSRGVRASLAGRGEYGRAPASPRPAARAARTCSRERLREAPSCGHLAGGWARRRGPQSPPGATVVAETCGLAPGDVEVPPAGPGSPPPCRSPRLGYPELSKGGSGRGVSVLFADFGKIGSS